MTAIDIREELRVLLVRATGCVIQDAASGHSWPCGTCLLDLLDRLGLSPDNPQYHERNDVPDRANEVWRAILQIRDATLSDENPPRS